MRRFIVCFILILCASCFSVWANAEAYPADELIESTPSPLSGAASAPKDAVPSPILTPKPTPRPSPSTNPDAVIRIPEDVTVIEKEAFAKTTAEEIFVPASVQSIGNLAFSNCESLKIIHIANGDAQIAEDFLSGCFVSLIIDAPLGSAVKSNEALYRTYLCEDLPVIDMNHYVTLIGRTQDELFVPLYADEQLEHLLGYVKSGTVVISLSSLSFEQEMGIEPLPEVYCIRLSENDDMMYVSSVYVVE